MSEKTMTPLRLWLRECKRGGAARLLPRPLMRHRMMALIRAR